MPANPSAGPATHPDRDPLSRSRRLYWMALCLLVRFLSLAEHVEPAEWTACVG
jgi:hypothetical protein